MNNSKLLWFITTLLNVDSTNSEQKTYNFLYIWSLSPASTFREICNFFKYNPLQIKSIILHLIKIFPNIYINISRRSPLRNFFRAIYTPIEHIDNTSLKEFVIKFSTEMMQLEASGNLMRTFIEKKQLKQRYFNEYLSLGLDKYVTTNKRPPVDIMDLSLYEIIDLLGPDSFKTEYEDLVEKALQKLDLIYLYKQKKFLISKLLLKALGPENIKKLIYLIDNYYSKPLLDENNNIFLLED